MSEGGAANTGPWAADQILAIAEHGDRAAFTQLFARFAPKIKAYLIRRGVPPLPAEELAQDVMLTVWRKAEQFDPMRGSAESWIFTIARNAAIDAQRRERGAPLVELEFASEVPELIQVDLEVIAADDARRVRNAIGTLSAEQLDVVRLSFFDGRAHGEIAENLGLPLGTVKSRLRLAMKRLRNVLEVGQ